MKVAVLNPEGRDPEQSFKDGPGIPKDHLHAPINYHAYAACTGASFYNNYKRISAEEKSVIILIRSDIKASLKAAEYLKKEKKITIAWKECGKHQVAKQLESKKNKELFRELCLLSENALSPTPELVSLYKEFGVKNAEFIPTPYPIEFSQWDFSKPLSEKRGIFLGTRRWDEPTRQHAKAIEHALKLKTEVRVLNIDGSSGKKKLLAFNDSNLKIIEGPLSYSQYLKELSNARFIFQLDESEVPGQVAGDALLCRMPCVGGNSAIEQVAFSQPPALEELLTNDHIWTQFRDESFQKAQKELSFTAVAEKLKLYFNRI